MSTQQGKLEVVFGSVNGKTVLKHSFHRTPLQIVRPFELEPNTLTLIIINPTAGIMGGDQLEISVVLEPNAKVVLLTQSASKIHKMHTGDSAQQNLNIEIANHARLEYYPQRIIPFAESEFSQTSHINLEPNAEFAMLETWASGRIAKPERLAFRRYTNQTKVFMAGQLEYLERYNLEPSLSDYTAFGLLEMHTHSLNGIFVGQNKTPFELPSLVQHGKTDSGFSWIRAYCQDSLTLDRITQATRDALRQAYFQLPSLRFRT